MPIRYLAATLLLLLSACGGSEAAPKSDTEEPARSEVSIVAVDFAFEMSTGEIPAGEVETTLINEGKEPHQAGYYRLNDGIGFDEFVAEITADDSMIPQLASGGVAGHMRGLSAGESGVRPSDTLEPGTYAVLCSIRDPNTGKNHYELGMVARLDVT